MKVAGTKVEKNAHWLTAAGYSYEARILAYSSTHFSCCQANSCEKGSIPNEKGCTTNVEEKKTVVLMGDITVSYVQTST